MIKREDSLRGQGFTTMATDKPTKAKLQAAAAAAGLTLAEYIRLLADKSMSGQQGQLMSAGKHEGVTHQVESLSSRAVEMSKYIPMSEYRRMMVISLANRNTKFNDLRHAQMLYDRMESEFEAVRAKLELKERGQLELDLYEA